MLESGLEGLCSKEQIIIWEGCGCVGIKDMFFGPVAFENRPEILSLFLETFSIEKSDGIDKYVNPEEFSNGQYFPIVNALNIGLKVKSVEIDFKYPELQKANEETIEKGARHTFIEKRKNQKMGILAELMEYIKYLKNNPRSRVKKIS